MLRVVRGGGACTRLTAPRTGVELRARLLATECIRQRLERAREDKWHEWDCERRGTPASSVIQDEIAELSSAILRCDRELAELKGCRWLELVR